MANALPQAAEDAAGHAIHVDWHPTAIPIDIAWTHHWMDGGETVLSLAPAAQGYWLRAPGIADFLLEPGQSRVQIAPHPGMTDPVTLEHLLVDQVLPRLLAQRGDLLIHASAMSIGGRIALFLAPSGFGKSTLAALLHARGHRVLSDDCVQLDATQDPPRAIPTYPSLRLNPDSLAEVMPNQPGTAPVAHYSGKRRVPMPAAAGNNGPVDAIYILGEPTGRGNDAVIRALRPAEACLALIRHSFRLDLGDRKASARQLAQCSTIAGRIPAFQLDYPRDFSRNDALIDALTAHLSTVHG